MDKISYMNVKSHLLIIDLIVIMYSTALFSLELARH